MQTTYVHGLWKKLKSAKNLTNHNTVEVSAHAPVRGIWTSNYLWLKFFGQEKLSIGIKNKKIPKILNTKWNWLK